MQIKKHLLLLLISLSLACHEARPPIRFVEIQAGRELGSYEAIGTEAMVSSESEVASKAGVAILQQGGNAVDAATAVSFVLSVVLPHHTGIGGGGFALVRMAGENEVHALDFRERAPLQANRDMYLKDGKADPSLSLNGPLSVATPGLVAGILEMQSRFGSGKISREVLLAPAIALAENGFPVNPELAEKIAERKEILAQYSASAALFLPGGEPLQVGAILKQKDLAETLRRIAKQGAEVFYQGELAGRIVKDLKKQGGILSLQDFKNYRVQERPVIAGQYRGYQVFSMPPPSSGGVHLIQILNLLEGYDLASLPFHSTQAVHLLAETFRRAYADRAIFLGDPDFVNVPTARLTSKEYAKEQRNTVIQKATPSLEIKPKSTTHFTIIDAAGNIVASTQTINYLFGSGLVAAGTGIILNDEMDDFATAPGNPNAYGLVGGEANAIQPGKTPLSSMTPTLVLDPEGRFFLATGAAGGSRIITAVVQTLVNLIDFHLPPLEAVSATRVHHQWLPDEIQYESGALTDEVAQSLQQRGHTLKESKKLGRTHTVVRWQGKLVGVADPRGSGRPAGY